MMKDFTEYWKEFDRNLGDDFTCPNRTLFRFISHNNIKLNQLKVLDIGFGLGEDLLEMNSRGAETYGIDIDNRVIDLMKIKCPWRLPKIVSR